MIYFPGIERCTVYHALQRIGDFPTVVVDDEGLGIAGQATWTSSHLQSTLLKVRMRPFQKSRLKSKESTNALARLESISTHTHRTP